MNNGVVDPPTSSEITNGSLVSLSCEEGFELGGPDIVTCLLKDDRSGAELSELLICRQSECLLEE